MRPGVSCRLAALSVLLCLAAPASARQLSSLRDDARLLARDTGTSRQRFTDAQITQLLNEGQQQAIARTWCVQSSHTFTLVSGTTYYALPSDFLAVRRVRRDDLMIEEKSPAALDSRTRGWETSTGVPTVYFLNYSTRGVIGFAPFPGATTDTGTIKMDFFSRVADMSSSTDHPFDGIAEFYDFHHGLPFFAAYKMALIDGLTDRAAFFLQQYELMVKTMAERCTDRPNYLPNATGKGP